MTMKIAINGFGRIGRMAFRQMYGLESYEIAAINDLSSSKMLAHLLKYDSSQGRYGKDVSYNDNAVIVNGAEIPTYSEKDPENLPWNKLGIDVVLECTGFFATKEKSMAHIHAGAKKSSNISSGRA